MRVSCFRVISRIVCMVFYKNFFRENCFVMFHKRGGKKKKLKNLLDEDDIISQIYLVL